MESLNRLARRFSWTVWTDSSKFGGGPLGALLDVLTSFGALTGCISAVGLLITGSARPRMFQAM